MAIPPFTMARSRCSRSREIRTGQCGAGVQRLQGAQGPETRTGAARPHHERDPEGYRTVPIRLNNIRDKIDNMVKHRNNASVAGIGQKATPVTNLSEHRKVKE